MLAQEGCDPLGLHEARGAVSNGSRSLLKLGFGITPQDPAYAALRERFLEEYAACFTRQAALFTGVREILQVWDAAGQPWGVVTNKPSRFTFPLLDYLGVRPSLNCVVTPDMVAKGKPDPAAVLLACERLGVFPADALFIGDAEQDVIAGRCAGTATAVALWGYIPLRETPAKWNADFSVRSVAELNALAESWLAPGSR